MNTPIRRRKLYEEVATRIEAKIREGELSVGDYLPPEREIALEYGVGRTAIREAIFALQKMGLVATSSGERARVIAPSAKVLVNELSGAARALISHPAGMEQFQDARSLFEIGLARLAAQQATGKDIARLEEALRMNEASLQDPPRFQATDVAFHLEIAQVSGNVVFISIHEAVVEWLTEQRIASTRVRGASAAAYAAHKRIFEAIAGHETAEAEQAMEDHLRSVKEFYWRAVRRAAKSQKTVS